MRGGKAWWLGLLAVALVGYAAWRLAPRVDRVEEGPLALPELAGQSTRLDRIELVGGGSQSLVVLERRDDAWIVSGRDWPADPLLVSRLVDGLALSRLRERKTARAERLHQLALEDVSDAAANGIEVRLRAGDWSAAVVVGDRPPNRSGQYLRLAGDPQAWLSDRALDVPRHPGEWLQRQVLALPLPRVERVEFQPPEAPPFAIVRQDGEFAIEGLDRDALGNTAAVDAVAAFVTDLRCDDVAVDSAVPGERLHRLDYVSSDGRRIGLQLWVDQDGTWARIDLRFDEAAARARLQGASDIDARIAALREETALWRSRTAGRRFLLSPYVAGGLLRVREQFVLAQ
jgi:hypothetical protein